ncbi:MAG TPA: S9 family peptidase [Saprospiraceae bacterium]|nr:S9 family peptidase [Saprospiraceae bacterium]
MYKVIAFILPAGALLLSMCQTEHNQNAMPSEMYSKVVSLQPPACIKKPKELTLHGDTRVDNYYWLNDRKNQEVITYLEAENSYREGVMSHLSDYQEKLFEEMKGRIKQTDMSVPYLDNGFYYVTKHEEGKEYPIYVRTQNAENAQEEILLDVNALAKDFEYYHVSDLEVSPNNDILVYGEDTLSRRIYTLKFKNLTTGELYPDSIPNTDGYGVWGNDNKTVFYLTKDPQTLRPDMIWRHTLGTDPSQDVMIWHESDDTFYPFIFKSKSKKYLVQGSFQTLTSEYRILEADNPTGEFRTFQPRERGLEYGIEHMADKWYIRTNLEAKNFRLMECLETQTAKESWREVIPHRSDVLLEGMDLFSDYLVLSERINGILNLRILPQESGKEHYIDFGEDAYVAYATTNPEFNTEILRISYQSMTTPATVYDYNMRTRERKLMKQTEVLGGFDQTNYISKRLYTTVRDGVKVPISLVYHKNTPVDGTSPCLLYGYGSYGASMDPSFNHTRLSLLDRGFVYAIAHIRGGEEMGRHWYEDGKLLEKKNTFNDFIDCGQFLINQKYAASDNLFAFGGSAGGLLIGAVVNMKPEMWKGVIAAVPFVDVVTTMLDTDIPLTTGEYDEWGNPNDKAYYDYMLSYSPYDNVEAKDYPPILVTTGLHDSQVQYFEPAKWVAKLREMKTDKNPLLMYCNMETGHGGASGRFERLKETAMEWAFLIDLAGKRESELKG